MDPHEEAGLMMAAGRGDRGAFGVLVERHHAAVVRFTHRFLGIRERHDAEDLAQEVFLAAWKAAPAFEPKARVRTWLLRLTTHACLNHRRRNRLRQTVPLDCAGHAADCGRETDGPQARAVSREHCEGVSAAVVALPTKQRAAILLRHFDGLSYAEIADALDTSVSAVESLLFRARRTLGKSLRAKKTAAPPQVFPRLGAKYS
jgi:RNA polymerase sigma-70 factor (ECF subfamily)